MATYVLPAIEVSRAVTTGEVFLIASGDLGQSANQTCWSTQYLMEERLIHAFKAEGFTLRPAHRSDESLGDGYTCNHMDQDYFTQIPPDAPVVVAEAVWHYNNDILDGLLHHRGPILTIGNWSGQWPGLVGALNLNGCLRKAGVRFNSLWSRSFEDELFREGLREWLRDRRVIYDQNHVRDLDLKALPDSARALGESLAREMKGSESILGIFGQAGAGSYNDVIEEEMLKPLGVQIQQLSDAHLVAAMREVTEAEAHKVREWLEERGVKFLTGTCEEADLTDAQILDQCRMYIAALRTASDIRCDAVSIPDQHGLLHTAPASDLAGGLLNNAVRPPVYSKESRELYPGKPLPHFNEADECAGLDALVTNRVWTAMDLDPATTSQGIRWGERYVGLGLNAFVWMLQTSGAVPPSHLLGGYAGTVSERQPALAFPMGGGTLKGTCKPGEIVWSRVFVEGARLHVDLGRGRVVELPAEEAQRREKASTAQWPVMHVVLENVSMTQFLVRHRADHVNVAYAPTEEIADLALAAKAAMLAELGIHVHLCGIEPEHSHVTGRL